RWRGLASPATLAAGVVLFSIRGEGMRAVASWGVMVGVVVLGVFAFSKRLRALIRLNVLLDKLPEKLSRILKTVDEAVYFYRGHKRVIAWSLVAGIGNHIVSVASVMLIGDALGVGMQHVKYFVLIPIINIVSAAPIAPNGWGICEFVFPYLFNNFGTYNPGEPMPVVEQRRALSVPEGLSPTAPTR